METPNLNYINALANNDKDFKTEILNVVKTEYAEEYNRYQSHINAKDYKSAAADVHKLKHKISILGLLKSHKIASDYEEALRENNADLKDKFQAILDQINNYLKQL